MTTTNETIANPVLPAAIGKVIKAANRETSAKPYTSGIQMGHDGAGALQTVSLIAARFAATCGGTVPGGTRELAKALEDAGAKFSTDDVKRGFAKRWDETASKGAADMAGKKALKAANIASMEDYANMSPHAKAAHCKDNDKRKAAQAELGKVLSDYMSAALRILKRADDRSKGIKVTRPANDVKDVEGSLRKATVEKLPAKVAKFKEDGFEVAKFWQDLAASIVTAKRAIVAKDDE